MAMQRELLDEMVLFAEVVRDGSFSRAARRLKLAPSALSKAIRRLEDGLGARLLHRTTRTLALTEIGRSVHPHCERIISELEASERAIRALSAEPAGTLRVTAPVVYGLRCVLPLLPELMTRHPRLVVDLDLENRVVDLPSSEFDVAIRITGKPDDSSMVARRLGADRRVVCGSPAYFARAGTPEKPADLARHNCLLYGLRQPRWWFSGPAGDHAVEVSGTLTTNHAEAQRLAALAGVGLCWLSRFAVADALADGSLVACLEPFATARRSILLTYHHRDHLSPKVRAFTDFVVERLSGGLAA
jgi:DNA-binding transcriptional LysR family regulator